MTEGVKIKMFKRWVELDYLLEKTSKTHSCFLCTNLHTSHFNMLKVGAALCQPLDNIFFKREISLIQAVEDKLFKALVLLTHCQS